MTRREAFACLVVLVLAPLVKALEFSVFPAINRPDLLMILAITVGLTSDVWVAMPCGFLIGFFEDLITMRVPGARAVSLAFASTVASLLRRFFRTEAFPSRILIVAIASLAGDLACYGFLRLSGVTSSFEYFKIILAYSALWSVVGQIPVRFFVKKTVTMLLAVFPGDDEGDRRAWA